MTEIRQTGRDGADRASRSSARRRLGMMLIAIATVFVYAVPVAMFLRERHAKHDAVADPSHDVALDLKITVADFAKGVVTFQILPTGGKLMKPNGRLGSEVTLETDPGQGLITHTFKPDLPLTPWTFNAPPDEGDVLDYPFDTYTLELEFAAHSGNKPIAVATELEDVPHGLKAARTETPAGDGEVAIGVHVSRTPTMIFVALLSTMSLILVSMAACAVAWQVAYRGRKIEFSMMVWVAALLFVIPTVRNALPGGVPVGALIDFLVFFWLQIAAVIAMSSLVWTWIRRPV